ncbi:MAG TPA: gamma-glutamyl-gamma-aminobutyrate hydrolase family protein [Candidatus Baltobacteraceae bacterium]|nr:gamma-glutamyl-gamma-aminobutyrate hydrolase family protein [Candidatus Baltobacteraceae bacterium]
MRIGLSYHGGDHDYDLYPQALHRRAGILGITIETAWLAGSGRETRLDLLAEVDAVVFTGGADVEPHRYGFADPHGLCKSKPERDAVEWEMLEGLRGRPLPMLAICRGAQILNVFHGGTLVADLADKNAVHRRDADQPRHHGVLVSEGSLLRRLAGTAAGTVNSSHHQAIERLADGFRVSAVSTDGVIEAFEPAGAGGPFLLAVQWHPEAMAPGEPLADRVLDALLRAP